MRRLVIITWLFCMFLQSSTYAQYTITDLGALGSTYSYANGLNNSGQVVGYSFDPVSGLDRAFRTLPNGAINPATDNLGTLGGSYSYANAINASGQVVGYAGASGDFFYRAFRTTANSAINPATDSLGTLGPTNSYSWATAVNAGGQTVGTSDTNNTAFYPSHAFRTTATGVINTAGDLDTLGGAYSEALGINASGVVVGFSNLNGNQVRHAFRTAANDKIRAGSDLGTMGGSNSAATAINDSGQVVGYSKMSGDTAERAFRLAPNTSLTAGSSLGTLGGTNSQATAINTGGSVVGHSDTAASGQHAFVYDGATMTDLNALIDVGSGWVLIDATGINDVGQIVGHGTNASGQIHGFLLTPISLGYPVITGHPTGACVQPLVSFNVTATGSGTLTYQWKKGTTTLTDDGHITGATTSTLTIHNAVPADAATYRCMVSNASGSVHSNAATLLVGDPPDITVQPQSMLLCPPAAAQFTVATSNSPVPTYLWQVSTDNGANWNPAPGTNNQTTYTTGPTSTADNGKQYRAHVTTCQTVDSAVATLVVRNPAGDIDQNCFVDDADISLFADCRTGPTIGPPDPSCINADADHDNDVDQDDFGIIQRCYQSDSPPAPDCGG